MPDQIDRRRLIALAGTAGLVALLPAAALAEPVMGDVVLGNKDAELTVIEYASVTCPACAAFHATTWPQFKEAYIDTGKIRFVLREIYFDRYGLWAGMTARCGGEAGYYPMMDQFLKQQKFWFRQHAQSNPDQIGHEIQKIGRLSGLDSATMNACLSDQDYAKALIEAYQENSTADEVTSTPTFIIGGDKHSGAMTFEEISALVDAKL